MTDADESPQLPSTDAVAVSSAVATSLDVASSGELNGAKGASKNKSKPKASDERIEWTASRLLQIAAFCLPYDTLEAPGAGQFKSKTGPNLVSWFKMREPNLKSSWSSAPSRLAEVRRTAIQFHELQLLITLSEGKRGLTPTERQQLIILLSKLREELESVLAKIYGKTNDLQRSIRVESVYNELGKSLVDSNEAISIRKDINTKQQLWKAQAEQDMMKAVHSFGGGGVNPVTKREFLEENMDDDCETSPLDQRFQYELQQVRQDGSEDGNDSEAPVAESEESDDRVDRSLLPQSASKKSKGSASKPRFQSSGLDFIKIGDAIEKLVNASEAKMNRRTVDPATVALSREAEARAAALNREADARSAALESAVSTFTRVADTIAPACASFFNIAGSVLQHYFTSNGGMMTPNIATQHNFAPHPFNPLGGIAAASNNANHGFVQHPGGSQQQSEFFPQPYPQSHSQYLIQSSGKSSKRNTEVAQPPVTKPGDSKRLRSTTREARSIQDTPESVDDLPDAESITEETREHQNSAVSGGMQGCRVDQQIYGTSVNIVSNNNTRIGVNIQEKPLENRDSSDLDGEL